MIILFLCVGALALTLRITGGGVLSASEIDLSHPSWGPTLIEERALDAVNHARLQASPEESLQVTELLAAYETYNQADLRYDSNPRATALADAKAEYEQRAITAIGFMGEAAYMGLGARLVGNYLEAMNQGEIDVLERLGGTFLTQARLTGLVSGERAIRPGYERMIPIVFMARWAYAVSARVRPDKLLSQEEIRLLLRWKLTANPLVTPHRRAQIASQLQGLGTEFPVRRALAARAADEGDWATAGQLYAEIAQRHPEDRRARATALYALSKAQSPQIRSQGGTP
jgi:hypothetical protein